MTWVAVAIVCLPVFAGVVAERVVGLGLSLVAAPLLALAIGPVDTVRLLVILALPINLGNALLLRRSVTPPDVIRIAIPAVVLMPVFAFAVQRAPRPALTVLAGLACAGAAAVIAAGRLVPGLRGTLGAIASGGASAALNAIAGLSGPPVALYAANAGWTSDRLRGNLQSYFLVLGVVAIPSLGLPHLPAEALFAAAASGVLGFAAGALLAGAVSEKAVRSAVLAVSAAGGVFAIVYGLVAM